MTDNVIGCVIGEITPYRMEVLYDGRQQRGFEYYKSEHEAMKAGRAKVERLKQQHAGVCYDDGKEWEVRVSG